ncbi:MAG: molybdopterin-dependent oxidoreductase [Anaerolineaceae bacterium]|nr:molybdopterin-dependent oxidoreductase [Anaerolineaceae bacterium]
MVNLTIDGKEVEVPEGTTVLRAAQAAGIDIPTLCDHPKLTPYGGCRLCLVEVEGARTLQPSCTLPAGNKMVVRTNTPGIEAARKFVLTMIFSERNHFCPFCEVSGGDCDLQNAAYHEEMTHWPLQPNWQPYPVDASHPFFILDNNRCILCRRCVRACGELAGNFTLGFEERGAKSFLVADLGTPLGESSCVSCGTCTQVCPTGALIVRSSAYMGKDAQSDHTQSICIGCSVGCGIDVITRDNHLLRIDGNWDAEVNNGVLCKFGRFVPASDDRERIVTPMVRKDGKLQAATWDEALGAVAAQLQPLAGKNGDGLAAFASSRLPAEALYAFKSLFASALNATAASLDDATVTQAAAQLANQNGKPYEGKLSDIESADCVVLAGVDLGSEHQVAGFFVKRMLPQGTKLVIVDSQDNSFDHLADATLKPAAGKEAETIQALAAALSAPSGDASIDAAAALLAGSQKLVMITGKGTGQSELKALYALATCCTDAVLLSTKGQANSLAAAQYGLAHNLTVEKQQAVYVALGDDQPSQKFIQQVEKAPFLAVQAAYVSQLTAMANVVLPVENWAELEGHFVNMEGRIQLASPALSAAEGVWSNQAVFEALGQKLGSAVSTDAWQAELSVRTAAVEIA